MLAAVQSETLGAAARMAVAERKPSWLKVPLAGGEPEFELPSNRDAFRVRTRLHLPSPVSDRKMRHHSCSLSCLLVLSEAFVSS